MAIRDIFKVSRKTFVDPVAWIDYESIKFQNKTMWSILKGLLTTPTPAREETFEAAVERLKLTEEDVAHGARNYRLFALFFLFIAFLVFAYSFYLLFRYHAVLDWILGIAVMGLFLSQAFKYDFWSLQMRRRKLGMTFDEWKKSMLGEGGRSS